MHNDLRSQRVGFAWSIMPTFRKFTTRRIHMTKLRMMACSLLVAGVAGVIAYPVIAHCGKCAADGKKIAAQLDQNKMTLAKAVTAAEAHSKGRAISVISELNDKDKVALEVYCIAGDPPKIMKCNIDGTAGSVIDMKEVSAFPITEEAGDHQHGKADSENTPAAAKTINNQVVEVGCGSCIYSMSGVKGCQLAVKIDGKSYLVTGADHVDAHKYCSAAKQATVSGRIEGDKFVATKFEVKS
jgi:hypothetical protein